jgi:hypothetical protein
VNGVYDQTSPGDNVDDRNNIIPAMGLNHLIDGYARHIFLEQGKSKLKVFALKNKHR